jgi:dTMP kinase
MEAGGDEFFERVRAAYLDLARRHAERIRVVDGTRPADEIEAHVLRLVRTG